MPKARCGPEGLQGEVQTEPTTYEDLAAYPEPNCVVLKQTYSYHGAAVHLHVFVGEEPGELFTYTEVGARTNTHRRARPCDRAGRPSDDKLRAVGKDGRWPPRCATPMPPSAPFMASARTLR